MINMTHLLHIQLLFIGTTELLLIGGVALLLFGGKKLPEMMRGLGQGVKEFKQGMNEIKGEDANNQPEEPVEGKRVSLTEDEKTPEKKDVEQ